MTKTLKKTISRSIRGSLGRYIAILLIIMLGVAFLAGLRLSRPAMLAVGSKYIEETKLYDMRLLSTLGFDAEDVASAAQCSGVSAAQGSVTADLITESNGELFVYRAHMLTPGINEPKLIAGRMPEKGNECLADSDRFSEAIIGQAITLSPANSEDTMDSFAYDSYTVVGIAQSPLYLNVERGTTTLGNGSLTAFLLLPESGFTYEYYTELYLRAQGDYELYSDEYKDMVARLSDEEETVVLQSLNGRLNSLLSDAEDELDDAIGELEEEERNAREELADAKLQLEDALAELNRGETELRDAKQALDDAKRQLDAAAEEMLSGFNRWEDALQAGQAAYEKGLADFEAGFAQGEERLADSRLELEALEQTWADGQTQLDVGWAQYNGYMEQWQAGYDAYAAGLAEYEKGLAEYNAGLDAYQQQLAQLEANRDFLTQAQYEFYFAQLEAVRIELEAGKAVLDASGTTLAQTKTELDAAYSALIANRAPLDENQAQLDLLRAGLDDGWAQYNAGAAELAAQKQAAQAQLEQAKSGLEQLRSGISSYNSGSKQLQEGRRKLDDGWAEYYDGLAEYEDGVLELEQSLSDAWVEIEDARADIDEMRSESVELYLLDRTTNAGYVTYESDTMIVDNLAGLFPIFFFLISALVCSTTMQRMVDEDRGQIGTLRALGYSKGSILAKYLTYAGSAATIGCVLGYFAGGYIFPLVICTVYTMLYNIPGYICVYSPGLFVIALAASLLCSAGTTYFACRHEMSCTPAELIRPKAPAAGKRILLERITPVWKRLKFLHKVTLRNIFRFKKRMFMMILGICGCTALVLTGFGIEDSVANIANFQFDDIQKYDISILTDSPIDQQWTEQFSRNYGQDVEQQAVAMMYTGDVTGFSATKSVTFVIADDPEITEIFDLHMEGETVAYPQFGEIVISEKLAKLAGIRIGDSITLSVSDTDRGTATVSGIVENYVSNYAYLTGETYDHLFDDAFEANTLFLRLNDGADEYALSAQMSDEAGVASVSVISDTRSMIDNMMFSLNYIVLLILVCAGALAFIVLFNLGNINITERVREIATIKVLGFHSGETGAYVFRENAILSVIGIVVGLPVGILLHAFIIAQINVEMVSFKVVIHPTSYLLTVIMVLVFTIFTDLVLRRKIAKINMAESLKSIE